MFQIGLVVIVKQNLLRNSIIKAYVGADFRHTCYDWFGDIALQRVNQADDSQLAKQKVVCMVGQIILGILGVLIGGGGLIAFVVGLVKPPKVSPVPVLSVIRLWSSGNWRSLLLSIPPKLLRNCGKKNSVRLEQIFIFKCIRNMNRIPVRQEQRQLQ